MVLLLKLSTYTTRLWKKHEESFEEDQETVDEVARTKLQLQGTCAKLNPVTWARYHAIQHRLMYLSVRHGFVHPSAKTQ